jgi:hypothetical protein
MTVGGELYLLPTLVQTTNENESGLWLTPSTVDIPTRSAESMEKRLDYRKKIGRKGVGAGCLSEQVEWSGKGAPIGYITKERLSTPQASDHITKKTSASWSAKGGVNFSLSNPEIQAKWPTPTSHNAKECNSPSEMNRNTPTLAAQAGGKLNPMWVEWLMGWPIGWTDLRPLETGKFPCAPQQHGES